MTKKKPICYVFSLAKTNLLCFSLAFLVFDLAIFMAGWMLENDITCVLEETFSIVREQVSVNSGISVP